MRLGLLLFFAPPAPKKAFELMSADTLPVSCAFCLKASAQCQKWYMKMSGVDHTNKCSAT
jgi:hypothetical protein